MNWYLKGLKQYADFSGRARRKEFWMFALFNMIFAIAWTLLLTLLFVGINSNTNYDLAGAVNAAYYSYAAALMLPGMAVTVRRLHDVGRSGWWILIAFIPIVGIFWLLGFMLTEGQQADNEYGANPKTSPETFSEPAKLKSVAVALIVASVAGILFGIVSIILFIIEGATFENILFMLFRYSPYVLLLITGVWLLNEKQIYGLQEKGKNAMLLLLVSVAMFFVLPHLFGTPLRTGAFIHSISYLFVALFAFSILFTSHDKRLISKLAVTVVVFFGLHILWSVQSKMGIQISGSGEFGLDQIRNILNVYSVLLPVAFVVLAGTFYLKKE